MNVKKESLVDNMVFKFTINNTIIQINFPNLSKILCYLSSNHPIQKYSNNFFFMNVANHDFGTIINMELALMI